MSLGGGVLGRSPLWLEKWARCGQLFSLGRRQRRREGGGLSPFIPCLVIGFAWGLCGAEERAGAGGELPYRGL